MSEWISVKDKLPEPYTRVLVYDTEWGIQIDYIRDNREFAYKGYVTHWQPLPEPLEKENDNEP